MDSSSEENPSQPSSGTPSSATPSSAPPSQSQPVPPNPAHSKDPVWKHCVKGSLPGKTICNYCGIEYSGGANRMKYYLAGIPCRDAKPCLLVGEEARREMNAFLEAFHYNKDLKKRSQQEMARPPQPPIPPFPGVLEEVQSSVGPRLRQGQGSFSGTSSSAGLDFFVSRTSPGSQPSLHSSWNKQKFEEARKACANFWYYSDIPFNVANSPYWEYMVNAIVVCGPGFKAPTYHDFKGPLLEGAVTDINIIINEQRKIWKKKGCSILSDGWTDRRGRTLINFLVSSAGGLVFLKSVDASEEIKNANYLFKLLEGVIEVVGPENVVQIITDNATAYVAAGRLIEERFPSIFWSPCAAHCLDLLLEDIGKIDWVKQVIETAKTITKFIYGHTWVLNMMRNNYTEGKDIVRAGATRFATQFISLQSLCEKMPFLKQMCVGNEWRTSKYEIDAEGRAISKCIFDDVFWKAATEILEFSEPLVRVLRLVDGEESPMGFIYEAMDRAKEAIARFYMHNKVKYDPLWQLIDRRWTRQLHRPLHAAGYFLNPKFFYSDTFEEDVEVSSGFQLCIERMVTDVATRVTVSDEIAIYREARGYLFQSPQCVYGRDHMAPVRWWEDYGAMTPNLKRMAIRILSQPCSASGCERNWSTFENIHSKKRSKLTQKRLNDLVYVHYNLRLRHRLFKVTSNEPINLDEIDPSEHHAAWVTDAAVEPEHATSARDEDFTFEDYEALEQQAIAEGEEEERTAAERATGSASQAPAQPQEEVAPPPPPSRTTRANILSQVFNRQRKGKGKKKT